MTSMNRSEGRNVFFYSENDPKVVLGGLIQNGSVTCSNFLFMLAMLIVLELPSSLFIVVHRESGNQLEESEDPLPTGSYDIISTGLYYYYTNACLLLLGSKIANFKQVTFLSQTSHGFQEYSLTVSLVERNPSSGKCGAVMAVAS